MSLDPPERNPGRLLLPMLAGLGAGGSALSIGRGEGYHAYFSAVIPALLVALLVHGWLSLARARKALADEADEVAKADRVVASAPALETALHFARREGLVWRNMERTRLCVESATLAFDPRQLEDDARAHLIDQGEVSRQIASLAVMLGLLGTLAGLTVSVLSLQSVGTFQTARDVPIFLRAAGQTLEGFGSAFVAAGLGVLVSILLTVSANRYERAVERVVQSLMRLTIERLLPAAEKEACVASPNVVMGAMRETVGSLAVRLPDLVTQLDETSVRMAEAVELLEEVTTANAGGSEALKEATADMRSAQDGMKEKLDALKGVADSIENFQKDFASKGGQVFEHIVDGSKTLAGGFERLDKTLQAGSSSIQKEIKESVLTQVGLVQGLLDTVNRHQEMVRGLERLVAGIPTVTVVGGTAEAAEIRRTMQHSNEVATQAIQRLSERVDALTTATRRMEGALRSPAPFDADSGPSGVERLKEWLDDMRGRFKRD